MNEVLDAGPRPALAVEQEADGRSWTGVVVAALGSDLAVRSGVAGLAGAVLVSAVTAGLLAGGRLVNPAARALVMAAPLFGAGLVARQSAWVVGPDLVAAAGLLALACSLARHGDPLDLSVPALMTRGVAAAAHCAAAPAFLLHGAPVRAGRARLVLRGGLLALPIVLPLGVLLAAADPVFASLFRLPGDASDLVAHVALLVAGGWGMAALTRVASAGPAPDAPTVAWRLGRVEATTVLGALVALYAAFSGAQAVAALGGAERVLSTEGLTYAEYARSGFFQLLAVATLTIGLLLALRAATGDLVGLRGVLARTAVGLTLVIVAVAMRRLWLYEQAFGLTMLRLYAMAFAAWIAAVFVLLAASLAGVGRPRAWLLPAAAGAVLVLLLSLNVANPEAVVVRRNLARAATGATLDGAYLARLSDDAVPALVEGIARLPAGARAELAGLVCAEARARRDGPGGLWAFNAAREAATEARLRLCRPAAGARDVGAD